MRCEEVPERGAEGPESTDGPPALTTALSPRRKHLIMRDPQDIAKVCGHESVEVRDGVDPTVTLLHQSPGKSYQ